MPTSANHLSLLRDSTSTIRRQIEGHALYREITTVMELRLFMEIHVFAVWDFMSLLKTLQHCLTSVSVPWVPSPYPNSRRLINEIVLEEESDAYRDGHLSHFELYLEGMRQAGADTGPIKRLIGQLQQGVPLAEVLAGSGVPEEAQVFIRSTFDTIRTDKPHITAAAFTFGREDLIPTMFRKIVRDLRHGFEGLAVFEYYLERHIEVDDERHGPMALGMLEDLCGDDDDRWAEASNAAKTALEARLRMWDAIVDRLVHSRAHTGRTPHSTNSSAAKE
jgi:hypothetical protein